MASIMFQLFIVCLLLVSVECIDKRFFFDSLSNILKPTMNLNTSMSTCNSSYADIAFLLDTSGSVSQNDFLHQKQFISTFINALDVGPHQAQISVITYSTHAHIEFYLDGYNNKADVLERIKYMNNQQGNAHTWHAMDVLRDYILKPEKGDRRTAPNFVVILTNGHSQYPYDTYLAAEKLRNDGVTIFAVGIGDDISENELLNIGGDREHVFNVRSYDLLGDIQKALHTLYCDAMAGTICDNKIKNCDQYNHLCSSDYYRLWAEENCPQYCGFCIPVTAPTMPSPQRVTTSATPIVQTHITNTKSSIPPNSTKIGTSDKPIVQIRPSTNTVIEANYVTFSCAVNDGNPQKVDSFSWTKGGNTIGTNQNYTLIAVRRDDAGVFSCTGTNSAGTSNEATVTLSVLYPPEIDDIPKKTLQEGTTLNVLCTIKSSNPPVDRIYWTRTNDPKFRQNSSVLSISNITKGHTDNYTCHAENTMSPTSGNTMVGRDQRMVTVNVLPSQNNCEDKILTCASYGPDMCAKYHDWAAVQCAKFCLFCGENQLTTGTPPQPKTSIPSTNVPPSTTQLTITSTTTAAQALTSITSSVISSSETSSAVAIPMTTIIPTPPPLLTLGICRDEFGNCLAYGLDVCSSYRLWSIKNCARFCGFCHGSQTPPPLSKTTSTPMATSTMRKPHGSRSCSSSPSDTIILLDTQFDTIDKFKQQKSFLYKFMDGLDYGDRKVQIGIATPSSRNGSRIYLNQYHTKSDILAQVNMLQANGRNSSQGIAQIVDEMFSTSHGDRQHVPNILLMIIDGHNGKYQQSVPQRLQHNAVTVLVVTVGRNTSFSQVEDLVTMRSDAFNVNTIGDIMNIMML